MRTTIATRGRMRRRRTSNSPVDPAKGFTPEPGANRTSLRGAYPIAARLTRSPSSGSERRPEREEREVGARGMLELSKEETRAPYGPCLDVPRRLLQRRRQK